MIRSGAPHIWTTNYDQLFEAALANSGFPHVAITDDASLMENFEHSHLIIKMNGDFEHSTYNADLAWDIVFLAHLIHRGAANLAFSNMVWFSNDCDRDAPRRVEPHFRPYLSGVWG
jgi:hypothetical protein